MNGMMRRKAAATLAMVLAGASALAAGAALAAQAGGPFGGGNGPIDISADELEVLDTKNTAIWRGSVEAIQGTSRLRTPVLQIFYANRGSGGQAVPGAGGGEIQRMEADGPVYYVTPQQNARGDHATYTAANNTIVMTGNVVLVQDKNVIQGDRLVIDTNTNKATIVAAPGAAKNRRVRGVLYPSDKKDDAAGAASSSGTPASGATVRP